MSFDRYRRRLALNGGSESGERVKNTEELIIREFDNDPSYRDAKRVKHDLTVDDLGVRIANVDKSVYEKRISVMPNEVLEVGQYIHFEHKGKEHTYIIDEVEDNTVEEFGKATECRNMLKWKDREGKIWEFPCVVSYQSYGVKIFRATNDFENETSTNIDIEIPSNEITRKIPLNLRVMFGNSKNGIFKIGDIAVYDVGKLKLTCKKDVYSEYDDLANNLPYNDEGGIIVTTYEIEGRDEIKKNTQEVYKINQPNGYFELENNNGSLVIISNNADEITLTGFIVGQYDTLNYVVNGEIVASKPIIVVR